MKHSQTEQQYGVQRNKSYPWLFEIMGGLKASGDMRYFQIRILHEQAQHLPGSIITKYFSKLELDYWNRGYRFASVVYSES